MKPRLLFFLSAIVVGGAERQTISLAKQLMKAGYPCDILAYYADHSAIMVDDEIRRNVRFVGGKTMRNPWEWPKVWSAISDLKPDIVIAVNASVAPIAVLGRAFGRYRARIACTFHTTVLTGPELRLTFPASRLALLFVDCLVYVCNAQRDYWKQRGLRARDSVVIHNGIDESRFAASQVADSVEQAKARLGFEPTDYVIGLTAAFRPEKNHFQAIDALEKLRCAGIPAKLLLVGDGVTRPNVTRHMETLGLLQHVVFTGAKNDVRPFLKAMDVGLLCSTRGESFSLAALETMAMNVPMIMPRLSGCVEMVEGERGGRLFEVGNTNELVARLQELHDPSNREKACAEARSIVMERFTEAIMTEKYALRFDRMSGRGDRGFDGILGLPEESKSLS